MKLYYYSHVLCNRLDEEPRVLITKYTCIRLAGFLKTLPPNAPFASNSFFSAKQYLQSNDYKKNQERNHCLFSSPSFFLLVRSRDFGAYRAQKACLLTPVPQMTANFVRLFLKKSARLIINWFTLFRLGNFGNMACNFRRCN